MHFRCVWEDLHVLHVRLWSLWFFVVGPSPLPSNEASLGKDSNVTKHLEISWGISPSASIYSNILGAASAVSTISTYWEYKTWDLDRFSRNMLDWNSCGGYAVVVLVDFGNGSGDEGGLGSCVGDGHEDDDRWLAIMMTVNGQIGSPFPTSLVIACHCHILPLLIVLGLQHIFTPNECCTYWADLPLLLMEEILNLS